MAPEQAQGLPAGASADSVLARARPVRGADRGQPGADRSRRPARPAARHAPAAAAPAAPRPAARARTGDRPRAPPTPAASEGGSRSCAARSTPSPTGSRDEPGVVAEPWRPQTKVRRGAGGADTDELHLRIEDHRRRAESEDRRRAHGETRGTSSSPAPEREIPTRRPGRGPDRHEKSHIPWPRRALAGVAAAGLAAWLARHAPGASPLPPALTACVAGVLVAALPRVGWLALTAFLATVRSSRTRTPAGAVLLVAGALVPVVLIAARRSGLAAGGGRSGARRDRPRRRVAGAGRLGGLRVAPRRAGRDRVALARARRAARGPRRRRPPSTTSSHRSSPSARWPAPGSGRPRRSCSPGRESGARRSSRLRCWRAGRRRSRWPRSRPRHLGASGPPSNAPARPFVGAFVGALVALVTRRALAPVRGARWAKDCAPTA